MKRFISHIVGLVLCAGIPLATASATSPPREPSDYTPSKQLTEATKQYDDCVCTAARDFSSEPDATPFVVQKAEDHCRAQLERLHEQGRIDSEDPANVTPDLQRKVTLFVNQSTAATRVSAFAEVGMVRNPPVYTR